MLHTTKMNNMRVCIQTGNHFYIDTSAGTIIASAG